MTQREEFEAWFHKYDDNNFMTAEDRELMFEAWQAAKAQAVPEGWKLVPVEPTSDQFGGMVRDIIQWMRFTESKNQHSD